MSMAAASRMSSSSWVEPSPPSMIRTPAQRNDRDLRHQRSTHGRRVCRRYKWRLQWLFRGRSGAGNVGDVRPGVARDGDVAAPQRPLRLTYFGSTFGSPPGVPGGAIAIPGSTLGGRTVASRLASGAGWITPLGGTEESARLSGTTVDG